MDNLNMANTKVEANALIVKAYIECSKYLTQAKNVLLMADVPSGEIEEFMKERKNTAKMLSKAYFDTSV